MRTRTAPSERPGRRRSPPSTSRRRTAGRGPGGDRRAAGDTARHAARGLVTAGDLRLRRRPRRRRRPRLERRLGPAPAGAAALGDDVAGDLEEPDAERGRALAVGRPGALLEPGEVRQGGEERALGGVLRLVVVAELVERVAVHLGEVLPIQGLEPGRVRLRRLDEATIAVEVGEAARPASSGGPLFLNAGRAIALHPARGGGRLGQPDVDDLADEDVSLATRRGRVLDDQRRRCRRRRRPLARSPPAVVPGEPDLAAGRQLAARPARLVEAAGTQRVDPRLEPRRGTPRAGRRGRPAGRRPPRAATSSSRRAPAGSRPRPSRR